MARKRTTTVKVGRDAKTGKFMTVSEAKRRKKTAVVETIKRKTK
ncbi:MAG: hypothetical protein OXD54_01500 [Candidatus Poribacteria bacterium]|nr:hypothetical protein [Candidatus Poribacteria bacterium]